MTTLRLNPTLFHHHRRRPSQAGQGDSRCRRRVSGWAPVRLPTFSARASCFCEPAPPRRRCPVEAQSGLAETAFVEAEAEGVLFKETFLLKRIQTMEGRVSVKLGRGKDGKKWELTVGCNLPGKWTLHWGVTYSDVGSEWDQPPPEMKPQRTIPIKDYAVETPLRISSPGLEGELLHKVQIDFSMDSSIAAIHFVLKEEETGCWYQHRGRDFKIPLPQSNEEDDRAVGGRKGFSIWLGCLQLVANHTLQTISFTDDVLFCLN